MGIYDSSQKTTTTMPSWFTDAQKQLAQQAGAAVANAPQFQDTAAGGALSNLTGQNNPFMTAIGGLQDIASGAANPWLPNGDPNTQTALGGLFAAQNKQLNQMLPGITAREGAAGIGAGGFGSLRGQTATQTARGGALTTLAADQMKAALDAQGQGIQAYQGMGNIGNQYATTAQNLAKMEMQGNLPAYTDYANILGSMGPSLNQTKEQITSGSDMENIAKTLGMLKEAGTPISKILNGSTGINWLDDYLKVAGAKAGNWLDNTWDSIYTSLFGDNGGYASWGGIVKYI